MPSPCSDADPDVAAELGRLDRSARSSGWADELSDPEDLDDPGGGGGGGGGRQDRK